MKHDEDSGHLRSWQSKAAHVWAGLQAMISLLACSLEVAAAGVLTARKQFTFLVGAMMLTLGLVAVYCTAVRTYNWGLTGVWWGEWQSLYQQHSLLC